MNLADLHPFIVGFQLRLQIRCVQMKLRQFGFIRDDSDGRSFDDDPVFQVGNAPDLFQQPLGADGQGFEDCFIIPENFYFNRLRPADEVA